MFQVCLRHEPRFRCCSSPNSFLHLVVHLELHRYVLNALLKVCPPPQCTGCHSVYSYLGIQHIGHCRERPSHGGSSCSVFEVLPLFLLLGTNMKHTFQVCILSATRIIARPRIEDQEKKRIILYIRIMKEQSKKRKTFITLFWCIRILLFCVFQTFIL